MVPSQMAKTIKRVNISRLPPERKKSAWAWLLKNRPAEAELIQQPDIQLALKTFDAEIIVEIEVDE